MIAYVLHGKRDLRAEELPEPVAKPGEVLIRVRRMGICGSDVHYFATGHCGAFVPRRPFVLGHELAGEIVEKSSSVEGLAVGQRVAVDPSRPCGDCTLCRAARSNLCQDMRYLGSASTDPHVDGAFSSYVAVPAENCYPVPSDVDDAEAALLEPLSIATHAALRAGSMAGKSVLIQGVGTVGQLVLLVARAMGAVSVAVTDVRQEALDLAAAQGADHVCISTRAGEELVAAYPGGIDVAFETAGAPTRSGEPSSSPLAAAPSFKSVPCRPGSSFPPTSSCKRSSRSRARSASPTFSRKRWISSRPVGWTFVRSSRTRSASASS